MAGTRRPRTLRRRLAPPRAQVHCLPGFYVLGAPKCGTSALYEVLRRHPRFVTPGHGKESHFWTVALGPVAGVGEPGDRIVREFTRANGAACERCVCNGVLALERQRP